MLVYMFNVISYVYKVHILVHYKNKYLILVFFDIYVSIICFYIQVIFILIRHYFI